MSSREMARQRAASRRRPAWVIPSLCLCLIACGGKKTAGTPDSVAPGNGPARSAPGPPGANPVPPSQDAATIVRPPRDVSKLIQAATTYEVTYTPETVLFSPTSVASSVRKISDDGVTFTFDAASEDAKKLKAGSVLLLTGVALRSVTGVSQVGDTIVATTGEAAITDAIEDGTIESKMPVDFGAMLTAMAGPPLDSPAKGWSILPAAYAASAPPVTSTPYALGPQKFSFQINPFNYTITFTPAPGRMKISMTVTETTTNMGYNATGYIKNFDSLMNIVISKKKITKMDFTNSGLESDLTLSWSMASQVAGPMSKIGSWTEQVKEHPALKGLAIYVPFTVGAVPFTLKFTGGITFIPAFTSKNTVLDGHLTIHYSGSAGFTVNSGSGAQTGSINQTAPQNPVANVISLGPIGFTVAVEFPRIEVGLGINVWAVRESVGFGIGGFSPAVYVSPVTSFGLVFGGPAAMLPCETHTLGVSVNAGVSVSTTVLSFIGSASKLTMDKQVYKKMYTGPKPGMMLCPS